MRIHLESLAKLHIQQKIVSGEYEMVWSYVLDYENSKNPFVIKREAIYEFSTNMAKYVGIENSGTAGNLAKDIEATGVKSKDALHVACALIAGCDYFLTTDDRLLKHKSDKLRITSPTQFINETEGNLDD